MAITALLLWALAADPALVTVRASGRCPSGPAVSEALAILVAPADPPRAPDLAEIELRGAALVISLRRASGELVGERELAAPPDCQERAQAAAIILAAWETRLGARPARDLRLSPSPPPLERTANTGAPPAPVRPTTANTGAPLAPVRATAVTAASAGLPATIGSPPPTASPPSAPPALAVASGTTLDPPSASEGRGSVVALGAALLASVNADDAAAAVAAEAAWSRAGSRFGIGGGALYVASHATAVSPGVGSWRRFGLIADGRRRATWSGAWLEARAGLALTALAISGRSLADSRGGTTLDPGAIAGARVGLPQGALNPWLEVAATFWPRPQTLAVLAGGAVDLPRFELLLGVGLSFGWRR